MPVQCRRIADRPPHILFLCTGNATRSVLAAVLLAGHRPDLSVASAGTLVVDGQPLSHRTRAAFTSLGLEPPRHRTAQARLDDVRRADLLVGLAPEHVAWVRREHPERADRAATLRRLARHLPPAPPLLAERVRALDLAGVEPEPWEEVADPGGQEVEAFVACAAEVAGLVAALAPRL